MSVLERNREYIERYIHDEWTELDNDTRWKCIRCGWCCHQNWRVNLTWCEFRRVTSGKDLELPEFDREVDEGSGLDHPFYVIDRKCPFLIEEGMTCSLYPDWFYTCATYPFLMMPDGVILYHRECRGIGHGEVVNVDETITFSGLTTGLELRF